MSGWPFSTAASIANAVASSENGTSSVARSTGRPPDEAGERPSREFRRRSVSTLFRVEPPPGRTARRAVVAAAPGREEDEEPASHHDRDEHDEALADDDDQRHHDSRRDGHHAERLELVPAHVAEQALVLGGRDLLRVPRAAARLAAPALPVGNILRGATFALDRDRRPAQTDPIVRRGVANVEN